MIVHHNNRTHRTLTEHQRSMIVGAVEDSPTVYRMVTALMVTCPSCGAGRGHGCISASHGLTVHPERLQRAQTIVTNWDVP